jgi:hypothetical protein
VFILRIIERVEERYEIREELFGRSYTWRPGRAMVECDCGAVLTVTSSASVCECGADHAAVFPRGVEGAGQEAEADELVHPWRYDLEEREGIGLPL